MLPFPHPFGPSALQPSPAPRHGAQSGRRRVKEAQATAGAPEGEGQHTLNRSARKVSTKWSGFDIRHRPGCNSRSVCQIQSSTSTYILLVVLCFLHSHESLPHPEANVRTGPLAGRIDG